MSELKRSKKTTMRQYEVMVNFIESHPQMIFGKLTPQFTAKIRDKLWNDLTLLLNSDGVGPQKTSHKWRRTWIDIKSEVKNKVAEIEAHKKRTGGGPPLPPLSPLYEKINSLIDPILITGDQDITESGRNIEATCSTAAEIIQQNPTDVRESYDDDDDDDVSNVMADITNNISTPNGSQPRKKRRLELRNCQGRTPRNSKKNVSDLIEVEKLKIEALNRLSVAMEANNELKREENNIQTHRNVLFSQTIDTIISVSNQFLNILNK